MKVYGIPTERVNSGTDIYHAAKLLSEASRYFHQREVLVVTRKNQVTGCINQAHLIYLLLDGKLYLRRPYLLSVKVVHEESLYKDEILKAAKKGRSVFVVEEGTKLGRFRRNLKIGSILGEIPVINEFEIGFGLKIVSQDYGGSLYPYEVIEKKKKVK